MVRQSGKIVSSVPGSGKTTYIVSTINEAIKEGVESIYAVTFSREAAIELKKRVDSDKPHISTIHSLAHFLINGDINTTGSHDYYSDMIDRAIYMLKSSDVSIDIDLLACDEHQDINPRQAEFIGELAIRAKRVVIVGDPMQSIYSFQGADPNIMSKTEYLGDRTIEFESVEYSYRFGPCISKFVNSSFTPNILIDVDQDKKDTVNIINCSRDNVISEIDKLQKGDNSRAILFRTNAEIEQYINSTKCNAINYSVPLMTYSFPAFCATIVAIDRGVPVQLLISALSYVGIQSYKLNRILRSIAKEAISNLITLRDLQNIVRNKPGEYSVLIPPDKNKYIISQNGCTLLHTVVNTIILFSAFIGSFDRENISRLIDYTNQMGLVCSSFWNSTDITDEIIEAVYQYITTASDTVKTVDNKSNITVMTIHGSKGKEFDEVTVVANPRMDIYSEEEFRVMYVACTRAKEKLEVIIPDDYIDRSRHNIIDSMNIHGGII